MITVNDSAVVYARDALTFSQSLRNSTDLQLNSSFCRDALAETALRPNSVA